MDSQKFQSQLQAQLSQISHPMPEQPLNNISKMQNVFNDSEFSFVSTLKVFIIKFKSIFCAKTLTDYKNFNFLQLKFLPFDELKQRMANLDDELEKEINELKKRYQTKRQPILDAMDTKRKRQQNF